MTSCAVLYGQPQAIDQCRVQLINKDPSLFIISCPCSNEKEEPARIPKQDRLGSSQAMVTITYACLLTMNRIKAARWCPSLLDNLGFRAMGKSLFYFYSSSSSIRDSPLLDPSRGLSEERKAIYDMALDFSKNELAPNMKKWDAEEHFPVDVFKRAAQLGFSGIYTSAKYGGSGLGRFEASLIFEALSSGCVSTSAYLSIHNMCTWIVDAFASEGLAKQYVPALLSMEKMSSYCLTEPNAGSDSASLSTTAKRQGDRYILQGSKVSAHTSIM